jgi:hypothetical protein
MELQVVDWICLAQNKDIWRVCQLLKEESAPWIWCICLDYLFIISLCLFSLSLSLSLSLSGTAARRGL